LNYKESQDNLLPGPWGSKLYWDPPKKEKKKEKWKRKKKEKNNKRNLGSKDNLTNK